MIDAQTRQYLRLMTARAADACVLHRLIGVNLRNEDGSSRQRYIGRCKPLDRLKLVSAPRATDPRAVGVVNSKGHQLGYLDRRCALETMNAMKNGTRFEVVVAGRWQDPNGAYGLVVAIFHLKAGCESLKQAEVDDRPTMNRGELNASVVQRWNLGVLLGTLAASEQGRMGGAFSGS
jgi:hypothetical protein